MILSFYPPANHCRDQLKAGRKDAMQTVLPSELKRGMTIMLDGTPHLIEDFHTSGTAQTRHRLHVRLRHLKNGRLIDRVLAENERLPLADLEYHRVQFSYQRGADYVFLDANSFEELELTSEQMGDRNLLLKENDECKAMLLEGKLLDIILPAQVALEVVDTAPAQRGGSDASWKSARLETGLETMVPLFIGKGDLVRVDTQTRKYLGKENPPAGSGSKAG
ncbi:MAG: hypothetical protein M1608_01720 [Candidatus Omnitrophica bacterium]|nr:hypothetical protein [Candidatus Omnitrophota bacterium]